MHNSLPVYIEASLAATGMLEVFATKAVLFMMDSSTPRISTFNYAGINKGQISSSSSSSSSSSCSSSSKVMMIILWTASTCSVYGLYDDVTV